MFWLQKSSSATKLYYCNLLCYMKCSTSPLTFEAIAWASNTSFKWVFFTECPLAGSVVLSWVSCWDSWWPWGQSSLECSQEDASLASTRGLRGERSEVGMGRRWAELIGGWRMHNILNVCMCTWSIIVIKGLVSILIGDNVLVASSIKTCW